MPFLIQKIYFSSDFVSLFTVMAHKFAALFWFNNYILSTIGAYRNINLVKVQVSSRKSEVLHFYGFFFPNHIVSARR